MRRHNKRALLLPGPALSSGNTTVSHTVVRNNLSKARPLIADGIATEVDANSYTQSFVDLKSG
jgi:hypothetical protein